MPSSSFSLRLIFFVRVWIGVAFFAFQNGGVVFNSFSWDDSCVGFRFTKDVEGLGKILMALESYCWIKKDDVGNRDVVLWRVIKKNWDFDDDGDTFYRRRDWGKGLESLERKLGLIVKGIVISMRWHEKNWWGSI